MKTQIRRTSGFTLVEIMIVVAIIALLAAIAIPNFVKARASSQRAACIANLKQINGAKATWALEQKKTNSDTPVDTDLYGSTQYIRIAPSCPGLRRLCHRSCLRSANVLIERHRRAHALIPD